MSAHPILETNPDGGPDGRMLLARIRHVGRTLDDLEGLRIRHENRRGAFERDYQIPLPPDAVSASLARAEKEALDELLRLWRQHPLAEWAERVRGVGEKTLARLIAEIGDPADRKTVSQLWAYCGYDPTRRHRKGMTQDEALACGNPNAKKRCYLIATRMLMAGNRDLYDKRRAQTASREDWTDGRRHADALRIVAKQFLKELWIASRRTPRDPQAMPAGGDE